LIDFDPKGMPPDISSNIEQMGGLWGALVSVVPALDRAARLVRSSTSAGLYRTDTGERFAGSGGSHVYIMLQDGVDVERFLKVLHARCWLAGFGWLMVGAGGQLLERSIVDRVVGSPERLVFEGTPVLVAPLAQNTELRRPIVIDGEALDSLTWVPPITVVEQAKLRELRSRDIARLDPERAQARQQWVKDRVNQLVDAGIAPDKAEAAVKRICAGILRPDVQLEFDDDDLAGGTVADVIGDPDRFVGATLADPIEGICYGRSKAMIMRRADGSLWINSFAHGRTVYELRLDFDACCAAINRAPPQQVAQIFIDLVLHADLDAAQVENLRNLVHRITSIGRRTLDAMLKAARQQKGAEELQRQRQERAATRTDPRPQLPMPSPDSEYLPVMAIVTEVMAASRAREPPMRDIDRVMARVVSRRPPDLHELTSSGSNDEGKGDETRLPAPEQLSLVRHDDVSLVEEIERHIEFVNQAGEAVHLPSNRRGGSTVPNPRVVVRCDNRLLRPMHYNRVCDDNIGACNPSGTPMFLCNGGSAR
jgi:hypothetical protein